MSSGAWVRRTWLGATLALLAAACGPTAVPPVSAQTASPTVAPIVGGTVTIRLDGAWDHLDIQTLPGAASQRISTALYDRLVEIGPGGKLRPYLAKSWQASPKATTFTLRDDATCPDGTRITPTVVANSFKRYFTVQNSAAPQFFGPGPYSATADEAAGTITVSLGTPHSDMPYQFAQPTTGIVCPSGLANPGKLIDTPAGSGPFTVESAAPGDALTLKARADWKWGPYDVTAKTPGFPEKIVYKVVTNDTTAANLLLTGGLDMATFGGQETKRLGPEKALTQFLVHNYYNQPMIMNEEAPHPTAVEAVREALMTAVDPKSWNDTANAGFGKTGTSIFTSDMDCYDPSTAQLMPQPNPDKARSILIAAGYTAGPNGMLQKDGKPLTVSVVTSNIFASGPEYLAEAFRKAGITVDLQVLDQLTATTKTRNGNFDLTVAQVTAPVPAPAYNIRFLTGAAPPEGGNTSRGKDTALDDEVKAAMATSGTERCQHWSNVQRRLLEKHHLLPLASQETTWFSRGIDFVAQSTAILEASSLRRTR